MVSECSQVVVLVPSKKAGCADSMVVKRVSQREGAGDNTEEGNRGRERRRKETSVQGSAIELERRTIGG